MLKLRSLLPGILLVLIIHPGQAQQLPKHFVGLNYTAFYPSNNYNTSRFSLGNAKASLSHNVGVSHFFRAGSSFYLGYGLALRDTRTEITFTARSSDNEFNGAKLRNEISVKETFLQLGCGWLIPFSNRSPWHIWLPVNIKGGFPIDFTSITYNGTQELFRTNYNSDELTPQWLSLEMGTEPAIYYYPFNSSLWNKLGFQFGAVFSVGDIKLEGTNPRFIYGIHTGALYNF